MQMSTKTTAVVAVIIIFLATSVVFGLRFFSGEDNWVCQNGEWVKHGNPDSFKPSLPCGKNNKIEEDAKVSEKNNAQSSVDDSAGNNIKITQPMSDDTVSSPMEITGTAKGTWFFEGSFPVKLVDKNGKTIAEVPAQALREWMTTDFVPFRAILDFSAPSGSEGTLILSRDDPSGQAMPEEVRIPVILGKNEGMKVKVFFNSLYFDPESQNCEKVYAVERVVPKTKAVAKASLVELLDGITEGEKGGGYYTNINSGVKLKSVVIVNGVAKADFSSELESGVGGSCRTAAIRAQITETLKQFPTVKSAVISVEGKTEGILQP
jgi:hypothetical protein